jgi:hypothetical protein
MADVIAKEGGAKINTIAGIRTQDEKETGETT